MKINKVKYKIEKIIKNKINSKIKIIQIIFKLMIFLKIYGYN